MCYFNQKYFFNNIMNIRLIVILIVNVTSLHLSLNNNADERVYLFSNQSGNLIWSGAMNLAWN
jgi:hypothetical protein